MASSTAAAPTTKVINVDDIDYTLTDPHKDLIIAMKNLSVPNRTVTLPANPVGFRKITVKDQSDSAGTNTIDVIVDAGGTIDTVITTLQINVNNGSATIYSNDGTYFTLY